MPNLSDYNPAVKYGANLDVNLDLADIRDANNNELLELDTVASAVNYVRIANSATATNPAISTQGDDSNISLELTPSGTGIIVVGQLATATASQGASAGAFSVGNATINAQRGQVTIPNVGLAEGSAFQVNLTNNRISGGSLILAQIADGTTTSRTRVANTVAGAGSALIFVQNSTATTLGATLKVNFIVI